MPVGRVTVKVQAGTVSSPTQFWVLNSCSPYNAILERPWLHKMKAVPSTLHQRLKFPTPEGIMEVRDDQVTAKQCLIAAAHKKKLSFVGLNLNQGRVNSSYRNGRRVILSREGNVLKNF